MKVCEHCGGMGHWYLLMCSTCQGTGLICLGYESEARYAELVIQARERAARDGWREDVWEPLTAEEREAQYPRLARKVRRRVTVVQREVA